MNKMQIDEREKQNVVFLDRNRVRLVEKTLQIENRQIDIWANV